MRFQSMSFRCQGKLIDRFASTLPVLMRFGLSTHDRVARCGVSWTLCACSRNRNPWQATNTRANAIFGYRFHFWCIFAGRFRPSSTLIWDVCAFVLIHFKRVFKSTRFRWKRSAYVLMCTKGLNASKCVRFQTKMYWCGATVLKKTVN